MKHIFAKKCSKILNEMKSEWVVQETMQQEHEIFYTSGKKPLITAPVTGESSRDRSQQRVQSSSIESSQLPEPGPVAAGTDSTAPLTPTCSISIVSQCLNTSAAGPIFKLPPDLGLLAYRRWIHPEFPQRSAGIIRALPETALVTEVLVTGAGGQAVSKMRWRWIEQQKDESGLQSGLKNTPAYEICQSNVAVAQPVSVWSVSFWSVHPTLWEIILK